MLDFLSHRCVYFEPSLEGLNMSKKNSLGPISSVIIAITVLSLFLYMCSGKKSSGETKEDMLAIDLCVNMIKTEAKYPSSVDFSYLSSKVHHVSENTVVVVVPFSAKNGFGNKIEQKAQCIFGPKGVSEINII